MKTRMATFDDVEPMLEIAEQMHAALDLKRLAPFDREYIENFLAVAVHDEDKLALVSEDDGAEVTGMLIAMPMRHWFNPSVVFVQELMIWVKPEKRQSGAGKALVGAFEEWAALKGFSMTALSSSGVYHRKHMGKFCAGRGYRIESTIFLRGEPCRQS